MILVGVIWVNGIVVWFKLVSVVLFCICICLVVGFSEMVCIVERLIIMLLLYSVVLVMLCLLLCIMVIILVFIVCCSIVWILYVLWYVVIKVGLWVICLF